MSRISVHIDGITAENRHAFEVRIDEKRHWIPKALTRIVNYRKKVEIEGWFVRRVMGIDPPIEPTFSLDQLKAEHRVDPVDFNLDGVYDHQRKAFEKLRSSKIFALFMDCRSGKTRIAIDLVSHHIASGVIDSVVWLCPVSVLETARWQWERFSKMNDWTSRVRFFGLETASGCRADRFAELVEHAKQTRCGLIVDESHMIKNVAAKRSKRISKLAGLCPVRGLLSGTPITRNIEDVFNQLATLEWRILGYRNRHQFERNHLILDEHIPGFVRGTRNTEFIVDRLEPFVFEYFPESKREEVRTISCDPSDEQRKIYEEIKARIIERLEKYANETHDIYLLFTALQSVLSGYVSAKIMKRIFGKEESVTLESPKLAAFLEARAAIDDKAIVWCARRHEVETLRKALPEPFVVDGSVTPAERHGIIEAFRKSPAGTLVAMTPVAKRGIDIYECDHAFFFGQSFDYESREQAAARIRLPDKERPCYYYDMIYRNSLDERIQTSHGRKANIIREFLDKFKANRERAIEEAKEL